MQIQLNNETGIVPLGRIHNNRVITGAQIRNKKSSYNVKTHINKIIPINIQIDLIKQYWQNLIGREIGTEIEIKVEVKITLLSKQLYK